MPYTAATPIYEIDMVNQVDKGSRQPGVSIPATAGSTYGSDADGPCLINAGASTLQRTEWPPVQFGPDVHNGGTSLKIKTSATQTMRTNMAADLGNTLLLQTVLDGAGLNQHQLQARDNSDTGGLIQFGATLTDQALRHLDICQCTSYGNRALVAVDGLYVPYTASPGKQRTGNYSNFVNQPWLGDLNNRGNPTSAFLGNIYAARCWSENEPLTDWFIRPDKPPLPPEIVHLFGNWTWFNGRSVAENATHWFVVGLNLGGRIEMARVLKTTREIDQRSVVDGRRHPDDHCEGDVFVDSDGKIQVYAQDHNGPTKIMRWVSINVGDISAWDAPTTITNQLSVDSYCAAHQLDNVQPGSKPRIVLFYRGNGWSRLISDDGGLTWNTEAQVASTGGGDVLYMRSYNDGSNVHLCWSTARVGDERYDVTYMRYDGATETLYKADGTLVGGTGALGQGYRSGDIVVDSAVDTTHYQWIWDICLVGGNPRIVWARFPRTGSTAGHEIWSGTWNGTTWDTAKVGDAGNSLTPKVPSYSCGAYLDRATGNVVMAANTAGTDYELRRYTTADGGQTWGSPTVLVGPQAAQIARPRMGANDNAIFYMDGATGPYDGWEITLSLEGTGNSIKVHPVPQAVSDSVVPRMVAGQINMGEGHRAA